MAAKSAAKDTGAAPASPAGEQPSTVPADNLAHLQDMQVEVVVEMGRQRLSLDQALALGEQSVLELDKGVGDPVQVWVNGKLFARGEVVTVAEHFGVRLTEIVQTSQEA
jgi:flagellar motor switch protein FliN/FliY